MIRPEKPRLGEILIQQKILTQEQLAHALEEQKHSMRNLGQSRGLGRVLIEMGYATEEVVAQALARQLQLPYIDPRHYNIRLEVTQKLPEIYARRFRAILFEENDKTAKVGMADPTDLNAYDEIARILKREIEIAVVTESQLLATIDRVYRRTGEITGLAQELGAELGDTVVDFGALAVTPGLEEAPVVKLLQSVFEDATQVRASDIHIEPQEKKLAIRFRIDGVLHLQTEADSKIASALVLRLKLMSGLDISEKRLPQDGRFNVKIRNTMVDVRISTMPTQFGESVVMRLLNQAGGILTLDKLGMPPHILERMQAVLRRPSGMMLVTGPTGSGKTTTLYAALAGTQHARAQDHHRGRPGRIPPARHQPGAGARKDRAHVRARAALGVAPGPGRDPGRRNARPGNGRNRAARGDDRPHGAVDAAYQRRGDHADPAARHGRAALHGGAVAAAGARAAAGAPDLRELRRNL